MKRTKRKRESETLDVPRNLKQDIEATILLPPKDRRKPSPTFVKIFVFCHGDVAIETPDATSRGSQKYSDLTGPYVYTQKIEGTQENVQSN